MQEEGQVVSSGDDERIFDIRISVADVSILAVVDNALYSVVIRLAGLQRSVEEDPVTVRSFRRHNVTSGVKPDGRRCQETVSTMFNHCITGPRYLFINFRYLSNY